MTLLIDKKFTARVIEYCKKSSKEVLIFSAFVKSEPLKWLASNIDRGVRVKVISRWKKNDLVFGASDLEVYSICKDSNWDFGIDSNLHGKLFLFDGAHILLGSANLTNRGLSLWSTGNIEFGVEIPANDVDISKIRFLIGNITWVDDVLFQKMSVEVNSHSGGDLHNGIGTWSDEILSSLNKPVNYLWVNDLLFSSPQEIIDFNFEDRSKIHDFELLGLNIDEIETEILKKSFKRTRLFSWACSQLRSRNGLKFGAFTQLLHNSLLDNPLPYRREVKDFVAILFDWMEFLSEKFEITRYERTKSVKLKTSL